MSLIFALLLIGLPVVGAFYDVKDGELVMRLGANLRRQASAPPASRPLTAPPDDSSDKATHRPDTVQE
jgi:hypothetical protein